MNRNINFTNVCYTGCRLCAFTQRRNDADAYTLSMERAGDRVDEARQIGATEICMQGGIHPDLPGTAYFDLARTVKARQPDIHLHAFSPMEIVNGAARTGLSFRDFLLEAKAALSRIQDETGGFTEFVLLPFIHMNSPVYLAGVARPGPKVQENRAIHAVSRLMLHGRIDHVQTSWVKLGNGGTQQMLRGGPDDLGGTLMEETISRMAGADNGSEKTVDELERIITEIGRTPVQRTTTYGRPTDERVAVAREFASRGFAATGKSLRLLPMA
ncbi:radical SAM protein [Herbiconiux sp. 11R-BC]|uniref:radical SAM protein n=1 Tax=Herbiconiux sp. 11R-BC TaxID=3111637 RepID=UPI003C2CFF09